MIESTPVHLQKHLQMSCLIPIFTGIQKIYRRNEYYSYTFSSVSYADINGTHYQKGCVVFVSIEDETPIFGYIQDIIVVHGDCYFVLVPYIGHTFCSHFNAYEVDSPCQYNVIISSQNDLIDYHLLTLNKSFDLNCQKSFVCLKYHVFLSRHLKYT